MKAIVGLYFKYLELIIIGILFSTLGITLVAGVRVGGKALMPAVLSTITLIAIGLVTTGRRKTLAAHPELRTKPFKEFRLFLFASKNKIVAVIIMILILVTLGATYSTDRLLKNQARVAAGFGIPATLFNEALIIELVQISPEENDHPRKVTAVLRSAKSPGAKIENQSVGYETTYVAGQERFFVRIIEITDSSAKFFVERTLDVSRN